MYSTFNFLQIQIFSKIRKIFISLTCRKNSVLKNQIHQYGRQDVSRGARIISLILLMIFTFSTQSFSMYPAKCLNFDGVNDYVLLPATLTNNLMNASVTQLTIEYWFKGSSLRSAVRFQNGGSFIVAGWGTPGSQIHAMSIEGGTGGGIPVGAAATDGNWHHVAMTWQKNTVNGFKSYLDGVLVAQKNSSNNNLPAPNNSGWLGSYNGSEFTNGSLDKVRIWTRALTQAELIDNRFTELSSGTGLIASYNFNQGIGGSLGNNSITNVDDATSNSYDGTLQNFSFGYLSSNFLNPGPDPRKVNVAFAVITETMFENLSDAMTEIQTNPSHPTSNILITIDSSITEGPGGVTIGGVWNTLTIRPVNGKNVTVSGNIAAGNSLIYLTSVRNVTIDGINSGNTSLTLINNTVSGVSGTSTIRMSRSNNSVITRCKILGSSTGTECGTVLYKSSLFGGNSAIQNNKISNCDIGPAGTHLPAYGIYMAPGEDTLHTHSNNSVRNCNIYDYFSTTGNSGGIYVGPRHYSDSIVENKFYQTSTRTSGAWLLRHSAINIDNANGNNFQITDNTIGYSSSSETGLYTLVGQRGCSFIGINIKCGSSQKSVISGNTIAALDFTLDGTLTVDYGSFFGIFIRTGLTSVNNNNIGPSLNFRSKAEALDGSHINGIRCQTTDSLTTNGNKIEGIFLDPVISQPMRFIGIDSWSSPAWTCTGNIVGGPALNSINNSAQGESFVYGIRVSGSTAANISSNTIQNITAAGYGISGGVLVNTGNITLEKNTIRYLKNQNAALATVMSGIIINGGNGNVNGNRINNISSSNSNSVSYGIQITAGEYSYFNNMISLGSVSTSESIQGINETGGSGNFFYNSICITGTAGSGSSNTFAFRSTLTSNYLKVYVTNIFYNKRSNNGATGKHYAVSYGNISPANGVISDYNDLLAIGTGGVLGLYDNTDIPDLNSWMAATGRDNHSISAEPNFIQDTNLHIDTTLISPVNGTGMSFLGYWDDFDGDVRQEGSADIGADEFNPVLKVLNLSVIIEGFYNASINTQNLSDTLRAYLCSSTSPYNSIDSSVAKIDSATNVAAFTFSHAANGNYYIKIIHRNSIETWSSTVQSITSGIQSYDFTSSSSQAFGNNMIHVDASPVRFAIYSGDIVKDGIVNLNDLLLAYNHAAGFMNGYLSSDVNGDGIVNLADLVITNNNSIGFVSVEKP